MEHKNLKKIAIPSKKPTNGIFSSNVIVILCLEFNLCMYTFKVEFVGVIEEYPALSIPPPINVRKGDNVCSIFGCTVSNECTKLYQLPMCSSNMPASYQHIEKKRRQAWLKSIDCDTGDGEEIQICGNHFHSGKTRDEL